MLLDHVMFDPEVSYGLSWQLPSDWPLAYPQNWRVASKHSQLPLKKSLRN